ncbi:MAG: AAA family ATPase [Burkholderiaceae bacterium]|nr:AAA family ATPase [Burkholderiaceae bacterium]
MLVVLGGLPGTGKSTVAHALLARWPAVFLRIDTIEQALRDAAVLPGGEVGVAGYAVAYALARSHLAWGQAVLVECVNPLPVTRAAWCSVAREAGAPLLEVELVCSDAVEHRRRIATRVSDIPGLLLPTWEAVLQRDYRPWDRHRLVVDTAGLCAVQAAVQIGEALRARQASALTEPAGPGR